MTQSRYFMETFLFQEHAILMETVEALMATLEKDLFLIIFPFISMMECL